MFFKNNLHPATASASACGTGRQGEARRASFTMDEAEDFNAFGAGSGRGNVNRRPQRPPEAEQRPRKKKQPLNPKTILFAAVAVVALAIIVTLTVLLVVAAGNKDVTYDNNSYLVYTDEKDEFHVLVNGDEIEEDFEGEVALYPAADRSFAYIIESGDEGVQVYILEGKKLTKVTPSPVDEIYALASLKPGVVYRLNTSFRVYSEEAGEQPLTKQKDSPKNFMISADASTVIYSATENKGEAVADYLYIYSDGASRRTMKACYPFAISGKADYVYAYTSLEGQDTLDLYCINPKDVENPVKIQSKASLDVTNAPVLNVKGDELIYYVSNGSEYTTMLYRAKKDTALTLGAGILAPATVDPDIAIHGRFKDIYLSSAATASDSVRSTYYVDKKYESEAIAKFDGKFSPDGKYFYYVNNSGSLMQMDLTDGSYTRKNTNHEDIIDFAITEKGNLYTLDDDHLLRYYKVSTGKSISLSYDANLISTYNYANNIYFSEEDTENMSISVSTEGSSPETTKMDKIQITDLPFFSHPNNKRTYAYYYDTESGSWFLYYTGNGKSFDLISNQCGTIYVDGMEVTDAE